MSRAEWHTALEQAARSLRVDAIEIQPQRRHDRGASPVLFVLRSHREHGVVGSGVLRHGRYHQFRLGGAPAALRTARRAEAYIVLRRRSSRLPRLSELAPDGLVGGQPWLGPF